MWRDYWARLKERSVGMGALKNEDILFDYIARANPNIYLQPRVAKQQQIFFPGYLCPVLPTAAEVDDEESTPHTQVIWSPLFDGNELKSLDGGLKSEVTGFIADLPAGWRTAEQKMLEMGARKRDSLDNILSSCSSNSDDDRSMVWTSAQCLLHMKDITEPQLVVEEEQAGPANENLLEYNSCELGGISCTEKFLLVDDYEEKTTEVSMEESKYQTCSGGDGSVCSVTSSGIGRGKLNRRESFKEDVLLSEIDSSDAKSGSAAAEDVRAARGGARCKLLHPENAKLSKNSERKSRRASPHVAGNGVKEEKVAKECARPRVWSCGTYRAPTQQKSRKVADQAAARIPETASKDHISKSHSKSNSSISSKRPNWCLHSIKRGIHHPGSMSDHEVTSAGSTTNEEGTHPRTEARDPNAELISTLAEMNNRELRVLQCSAAIMRHNIGVLRDDVKGLQGCLEGRKAGYSWWTLFKDFVVAAGLVSGAFGLRSVIDMLKRTVRYGALNKITNKQQKMALAAFVLTVGVRFGKQIWREQGNASSRREIKLREQLSRINDRVSLMSDLATSDRQQTAAATDSE